MAVFLYRFVLFTLLLGNTNFSQARPVFYQPGEVEPNCYALINFFRDGAEIRSELAVGDTPAEYGNACRTLVYEMNKLGFVAGGGPGSELILCDAKRMRACKER